MAYVVEGGSKAGESAHSWVSLTEAVSLDKLVLMRFDPIWSSVLSDLFVDLSAGWFAAAFVVPNFANQPGWFFVLTGNLLNGIVFLVLAVKLKEFLGR